MDAKLPLVAPGRKKSENLAALLLCVGHFMMSCNSSLQFARHVKPLCHVDCTRYGNCNGDTGQCDCPFGYEGPSCEGRVMPACHTSLETRSVPMYGTWALKNCNCFRQLARIGCPPVGDLECLYAALYNVSLACFEVEGLPPEQQTSDIPREGFAHSSLQWFWGQPLLGRDAMNRTEPLANHQLPNGLFQLPLDLCLERCNERGICGGHTPDAAQGTCICMASYTGPACEDAVQEDCYLSCSGGAPAGLPNGTCIQGFCHCPPGRWGLACTRDEYYTSAVGWRPNHVKMRIFVYDLPQNVVHRKADDPWSSGDRMYLGEQAFISQLLRDSDPVHGVVTQNPWEANLFVVPTWGLWYTGNTVTPLRLFRHVIHFLRNNSPFWDELSGRNHVFWAVNDRGVCDWHHLEPELHQPIYVTHFGQTARLPPIHVLLDEETQNALRRRRQNILEKETTFRGFGDFSHMDLYQENMPCYRPEKDVVAPPVTPAWATNVSDTVYGANHRTFNRSVTRNYTFLFVGGNRKDLMYSQGVRQAIFHLRGSRPSWNRADLLIGPAEMNRALMAHAKFCLAPSGYGWGVRLLEAAAVGCVPVIVQDGIYQFLWDVLPYDEFSVRISRRSLYRLPHILGSIRPEQLRELQEGLVRWHRAFTYSGYHPLGLAYNLTLLSLRRRLVNLWSAHF